MYAWAHGMHGLTTWVPIPAAAGNGFMQVVIIRFISLAGGSTVICPVPLRFPDVSGLLFEQDVDISEGIVAKVSSRAMTFCGMSAKRGVETSLP